HQFLVMPLTYAEEIDDLTVQIIQHFNDRRALVKENLRASCKWFDVCRVQRKQRENRLGKTIFPADVWQRSNHGLSKVIKESLSLNKEAQGRRVQRTDLSLTDVHLWPQALNDCAEFRARGYWRMTECGGYGLSIEFPERNGILS